MVYAVIDTNIFVSALITHNSNASTARGHQQYVLHGKIKPLYNDEILKEYFDVLNSVKISSSQTNQICTSYRTFLSKTELILPVFLMLAKCQMRTTESSMKSA